MTQNMHNLHSLKDKILKGIKFRQKLFRSSYFIEGVIIWGFGFLSGMMKNLLNAIVKC